MAQGGTLDKVVCPCCGRAFPLEAALNALDAREAFAVIRDLPGELGLATLRYLSLFRQPTSKRGLSWDRAKRLAEELRDLATAPDIQWESRRILPNDLRWWAAALGKILGKEEAGTLRLPLKNHNLLRCIAYEEADKAAEAALKAKEESLRQVPPRPVESHEDTAQARKQHNPAKPKQPREAKPQRMDPGAAMAHIKRIQDRLSGGAGTVTIDLPGEEQAENGITDEAGI